MSVGWEICRELDTIQNTPHKEKERSYASVIEKMRSKERTCAIAGARIWAWRREQSGWWECQKSLGNWFTDFKIEYQFTVVSKRFSGQWKMISV